MDKNYFCCTSNLILSDRLLRILRACNKPCQKPLLGGTTDLRVENICLAIILMFLSGYLDFFTACEGDLKYPSRQYEGTTDNFMPAERFVGPDSGTHCPEYEFSQD